MLRWSEVAQALYGAWRLACLDPRGMSYFAQDEGAALRSFFAALLVFPVFLLLLPFHITPEELEQGSALRVFLVETIGYIVNWVAFPLAMLWITRLLRREALWAEYVTIYNWAQLLEYGFVLATVALLEFGILPQFGIDWFLRAVTSLYEWFIARTVLRIAGTPAAMIVLVDLVMSESLSRITAALHEGQNRQRTEASAEVGPRFSSANRRAKLRQQTGARGLSSRSSEQAENRKQGDDYQWTSLISCGSNLPQAACRGVIFSAAPRPLASARHSAPASFPRPPLPPTRRKRAARCDRHGRRQHDRQHGPDDLYRQRCADVRLHGDERPHREWSGQQAGSGAGRELGGKARRHRMGAQSAQGRAVP